MTASEKETMRPKSGSSAHDSGVAVAQSALFPSRQTVSIAETHDALTPSARAEQPVLQDTLQELEQARLSLATATAAGRADRSLTRESLERAQDLGAEVFRLREQLKMARLDADESYSRLLDLEMGTRQEQARLAELREHNEQLGSHLRQTLTLHEQDGIRWQAEVGRVLELHRQDTAVWQAEIARVQIERQQEVVDWQARLDAATRVHQHDNARWQEELNRIHTAAEESARTLGKVLSSRSWRMTLGMRRFVERLHGRRWEEPEVPAVPGVLGSVTRDTPDSHGDD